MSCAIAWRPINTTDSVRPKRTTYTAKAKVCVFSSCSFCPNETAGPLYRAFSDGIGESLIKINLKTQDDHVRTSVAALECAGDASALEKYYHNTCLRSPQHTFTPVFHSNVQVIRTVCVEQLLISIQTTLSDGVTLNMGEVNNAYSLIIRYHVEVDETTTVSKAMKIHPLKNSLLYTIFKVKDHPIVAPNVDFRNVINEVLVTHSRMDGEWQANYEGRLISILKQIVLFWLMIHLAITSSVLD